MNIGDFLKGLLDKFMSLFGDFIKKVFDAETKIVISEFKDFAVSTIAKLMTTDLTNESKRAEAFKTIKEEAIKRGKTLSDSMINLLIEMAVIYFKNTQPIA